MSKGDIKHHTLAVLLGSALCLSGSFSFSNTPGGTDSGSDGVSTGSSAAGSGGTSQGSCGEQLNRTGYRNPARLFSGSFGTAFRTTLSDQQVVLKISRCEQAERQRMWEYENKVYQGLLDHWRDDYPDLIVQRKGNPFICRGSLTDWDGLSSTDGKGLDCSANCCITAIEYASGPRLAEYIKAKPKGKMDVGDNDAKAWLFQISFALFAAFVDSGFQHWDLKTENIMTEPFPQSTSVQCYSWWYQKKEQRRCFPTKLTDNHHIKMIDFDRSTLGRTEASRVGGDAVWARRDADKLIEICEEIYDVQKCASPQLDDLLGNLNNLAKLTPPSSNKSIGDMEYNSYAKGFHLLLNSEYFSSLFSDKTDCNANCIGYRTSNQHWADNL